MGKSPKVIKEIQKMPEFDTISAIEELKTVKVENDLKKQENISLTRQLDILKFRLESKQKQDESKAKMFEYLNNEI